MELITQKQHVQTKARRATLEGADYLVASNVVLAVEGVMNGVFVPAHVLADSVYSWNGRPVPINHPEVAGAFVSASSPQMIEERSAGYLFNSRIEDRPLPDGSMGASNALVSDVWVNITKAEGLGAEGLQILHNILNNIAFDVSTGYFGTKEEKRGNWYGTPYTAIMQTVYPDHLALLPNQTGACTLPVCGVYAQKDEGEKLPQLKKSQLEENNMEENQTHVEEVEKAPEADAVKNDCGCGGEAPNVNKKEAEVDPVVAQLVKQMEALQTETAQLKAELQANKQAETKRKAEEVATAYGLDVNSMTDTESIIEALHKGITPKLADYSAAGAGGYSYQVNQTNEEVWE